jgi:hypothetical protein
MYRVVCPIQGDSGPPKEATDEDSTQRVPVPLTGNAAQNLLGENENDRQLSAVCDDAYL